MMSQNQKKAGGGSYWTIPKCDLTCPRGNPLSPPQPGSTAQEELRNSRPAVGNSFLNFLKFCLEDLDLLISPSTVSEILEYLLVQVNQNG